MYFFFASFFLHPEYISISLKYLHFVSEKNQILSPLPALLFCTILPLPPNRLAKQLDLNTRINSTISL